ncbi:MAG: GNAT family N-acetyltransferase [Candidatus Thiodiazotropha sp. DIVDIV]
MIKLLKYKDSYREVLVLPSGERIVMRLVQPGDKALLSDGFDSLSKESRFRRFLNEKKRLSNDELTYFTEVDQLDHFALGMVELDENGLEKSGVAIGRFIRLADDSESAEVGLTVTDEMQGKGIGRRLLERLVSAARERGIKQFRFECLPYNLEMKNLVQKVCRDVRLKSEAGVTVAEATITELPVSVAIPSPVSMIDTLVCHMQGFVSDSLRYQSGVGLDLMRHSLDAPFKLRP